MRGLVVGLLMLASPVAAEELPTLGEVLEGLSGVEVTSSGHIAINGPQNRPMFRNDLGSFFATFALDRDIVRQLDKCVSALFGSDGCSADIKAEIVVERGDTALLIYEVHNLVVPE